MRLTRNGRWLSPVALALLLAGCTTPGYIRSRDRYKNGVVFVLPGIEGKSFWNRNLAMGLDEGGVRCAIEVYDWTLGIPGSAVINIAAYNRNRDEAAKLARRIVDQRNRYPGSPVYLVGHSAGGAIATFAIEALPPGRQIDQAILLGPALSREYDLTTALRRTRFGMMNLYSELDVGFLLVGTTAVGTADRAHTPSAGCLGFRVPESLSKSGQTLYAEKLRQVEWNARLRQYGASGTHMGWTSREFAREYLAPIILQNSARRAAEDQAEAAAREADAKEAAAKEAAAKEAAMRPPPARGAARPAAPAPPTRDELQRIP